MEQNILNCLKEDREECAVLLLEQYAGLIWSVCAKRLQNEEDIKECVNSVFAEFFLHTERYDPAKGSIKNYLCQIADRRAIDVYRKNLRNQKTEEAAWQQSRLAQEESVRRQEEEELIQDALEKLEPLDSQILRMKYYDGMTYNEIAKILGMTYESVKKRGLRGKKKLLYIILVGLILAFLAACAATVLKYQFSPWKGFIWSEENVYELAEDDLKVEVNGTVWYLENAIYYDGRFEVKFLAQCMDHGCSDEAHKHITEMIEKIHIYDDSGKNVNIEKGSLYAKSLNSEQKSEIRFDSEYILNEQEKDTITFILEIEGSESIEFHLQLLPVQKTEKSINEMTLSDGSQIVFGQGYIGDDGFAIVNLFHEDTKEYVVSELVTNSFMGEHGKSHMQPYLVNSEGMEYWMIRNTWEDANQMEMQRTFNLYFAGAEAGEYMLCIPRLCIQKKMSSEKVVLTLPTDDNFVEYNQEVLFPDGTGFRITGITRQYEKTIDYNYDANGSVEEVIKANYLYYLEYEPIIAEGLEYLASQVQGDITTNTILEGDRYCIVVPVDDLRTQMEVQFVNPYYMINESYQANIRIEAPAE